MPSPRINYVRNSSGLEPSLLELVRMRASQINGYLTVGAARAAEGVSRFFPDIMVSLCWLVATAV
jgi:hypothetical protein